MSSRRVVWLAFSAVALLHVAYIAFIHCSHAPGTFAIRDLIAGCDVGVYIKSGLRHAARQPLYNLRPWPDNLPYLYHPGFAWLFSKLNTLGARSLGVLWFGLELSSYLLALVVWPKALDELGAPECADALRRWGPALLVVTTWFTDLYFLNVVGVLFLAAGVVAWLLASERDLGAAALVAVILLVKPHWAFPASLPLLAGQWRRAARLALGIAACYLAANLSYLLLVDRAYGLEQLRDYARELHSADRLFPWGGQWQHIKTFSLQQGMFLLFGRAEWVWALVKALKLAAVGVLVLRLASSLRRPSPRAVVWGMFAVYLSAMLVLSENHELTCGACIFACLRASRDRFVRSFTLLYLGYAYLELVDAAFGVLGLPGPTLYFPIVGVAALLLWWGCLRSLVAEQRGIAVAPAFAIAVGSSRSTSDA